MPLQCLWRDSVTLISTLLLTYLHQTRVFENEWTDFDVNKAQVVLGARGPGGQSSHETDRQIWRPGGSIFLLHLASSRFVVMLLQNIGLVTTNSPQLHVQSCKQTQIIVIKLGDRKQCPRGEGKLWSSQTYRQLVAWHSGRTLVYDRPTFPDLHSTYSWRVTTPSAMGQPTRPTQPFILSGSMSE